MPRLNFYFVMGLFALVTLLLAGAAIGRVFRLPAGDRMYLILLFVAVVVWVVTRRFFRKEQ